MVKLGNANVPKPAAIAELRQSITVKDKTLLLLNSQLTASEGSRNFGFSKPYRRRKNFYAASLARVVDQFDHDVIEAEDEPDLDVIEWRKHFVPTWCRDFRSHKIVEERKGTCCHY
jgi:hypothetical protein